MLGRVRYFLYSVAVATGLRRNELGSLTPESFDLASDPPYVWVDGRVTKNRQQAVLPLRRDLAAELESWLRGQKPGTILFPVRDKQVDCMIRADLTDAGIPVTKDGLVVDFHALRYTFVTSLALSGVPLAVAQKLARHSDPRLTANVYTRVGLADLSRAVETLPPIAGRLPAPEPSPKQDQQDEPPAEREAV
jgi:integrase